MISQIQQPTQQPSNPWDPLVGRVGSWAVSNGPLVVALLGAVAWRKWLQPALTHSQVQLRYSVTQDLEIKSILSQILGLCRADRVIICEFHNGERLASQRHWVKLSATQEIVAPGIQRIASTIRGIPQSQLAQELETIQDGHLHTLHRDHRVPDGFRDHLVNIGVHAVREQMLICNGEALGILVVHYREDPCVGARNEHECLRALSMSEKDLQRFDDLRIRLIGLMRHRSELLDAIRSVFKGN